MSKQKIIAQCIQEVQELHHFFQQWFAGELPNTEDAFGRFSQTLSPNFTIISPSGEITDRTTMEQLLRNAHGSGTVEIWIEQPQVRELSAGLILVLYEEWQRRDGRKTVRQSSALFRPNPKNPNEVEWLHVHETWIDQHN